MTLLPLFAAIWSDLPGFTRYGGAKRNRMGFRGGCQINEDGNEDENRIVEEADDADYEGCELADRSGRPVARTSPCALRESRASTRPPAMGKAG
jgi:hypothetical protein